MKSGCVTILLVAVVVCAGGLAARRDSAGSVGSAGIRWEYGVFRIGGRYPYEWQDASGRTYGRTVELFLEKMGLSAVEAKLRSRKDAPISTLEYTAELELLNHLGAQGWELVVLADRGPAGIPNRTFWFKRPM